MRRLGVLVIAALSLLLATAVPAAAAAPAVGAYGGGSVHFRVVHSEHGSPYVEDARFHGHTGFARAAVHSGGEFETCARHRINAVLARDTCIRGTFTHHVTASGSVVTYPVAHGHRAAHPSETHHWSAVLS